jgi:hypothetical protein
MPTATHNYTTPTRRSALGFSAAALIAGVATPVLAGATPNAADADLLAACAEFERVGERLRWINNSIPGPELTDAECDAALDLFYVLLERIAGMTPHTPEGRRKKAIAAWRALASTAPSSGEPLEREEQFALDALRDLIGSALA